MKYTKKQIQAYLDYMNFAIKEGWMDETFATEVQRHKAWKIIQQMMDKGDYYANEQPEN